MTIPTMKEVLIVPMYKVGDIVYTKTLDEIVEDIPEKYKQYIGRENGHIKSYYSFTKRELDKIHGIALVITNVYSAIEENPCSICEYRVKTTPGIPSRIANFFYSENMFYDNGMNEEEYYNASDDADIAAACDELFASFL